MKGSNSGNDHSVQLEPIKQQYLQDMLAARRKAALEMIMDAYHNGHSIPDIYLNIFQESLYEIGRLWESNHISVADEHICTAITQFIMSNLYPHLELSEKRRGRAVITGIEGELHQVGANMVSDILESDGWDVVFLGSDVPINSALQALRTHKADLLGISSTIHSNMPNVIKLVQMTRKEFGKKTLSIMLGGGAFKTQQPLPQDLEDCLVAQDIRDAVELTRQDWNRRIIA